MYFFFFFVQSIPYYYPRVYKLGCLPSRKLVHELVTLYPERGRERESTLYRIQPLINQPYWNSHWIRSEKRRDQSRKLSLNVGSWPITTSPAGLERCRAEKAMPMVNRDLFFNPVGGPADGTV